jgi:hypothetical protein
MKVFRLLVVLLCLAGTAMSCTDPMEDVVVSNTDPADKPGGNGGGNP